MWEYVYKMANNKIITGLVVALIVAFFVLFLTPSQCVPYSPGKHYARYEAFTEGAEDAESSSTDPTANIMNSINQIAQATTINSNTAASGMSASNKPKSTENFEPITEIPRTIEYGPFRDSEIIDKFSQVTANGTDGVNGCVSSGLNNSGGSICLTPELIKLLKTRGGNATGGN
jgi:hypothetical protein